MKDEKRPSQDGRFFLAGARSAFPGMQSTGADVVCPECPFGGGQSAFPGMQGTGVRSASRTKRGGER